ncbi:hypothetical protein GCM10010441_60920 [Kitasatospora paracochleata]|uniref:Uncharacterized protein n=1 Tax=Kitasatospora paracochleata TaxID=58354 RepID=A0ABT1J1G8_9ACTN|nr:DUF5958 family protein [Kitasatospora paracochleata]MCP2311257.1 hypothetical protein [Kitasatospora paracochleata]
MSRHPLPRILPALDDRTILLNRLAQELHPLDDGITWFTDLAAPERTAVLTVLAELCLHARATTEDAPEATARSGIRPTHTPAVLLARGHLAPQLHRIATLPGNEQLKSFRLLIALFTVADRRRRERSCTPTCHHPWHHLGPAAPSA